MSRSITIQPKVGSLPWRACPSASTTVGELEAAISMFPIDLVRTTDDEILLVQKSEAIRDGVPPPAMEELGRAMFGPGHDAILVTERTGEFEAQSFDDEASDRHFEQDADREMIGDDVDLGLTNIGNK